MITREDQRTAVLNIGWLDWKEPGGATEGAGPEVDQLQDSPDTQHDGLLLSLEVRQVVLGRLGEADLIQHRVIVELVVLKKRGRKTEDTAAEHGHVSRPPPPS